MNKKRVVASLLLFIMLLTNIFEVSYAINEGKADGGIREVHTWVEFKKAYNDQSVNRIELKADILNSTDKVNLSKRTESLIIYGDRNDNHENPYYILDLGYNITLELGSSRDFEKYLKLENIIIANATDRDANNKGTFINIDRTRTADNEDYIDKSYVDEIIDESWRLIFKNIKNKKSEYVKDDREMIRLAIARTSRFEFEGDIDIKTNLQVGLVGQVLIKEDTNFILKQINSEKDYQYAAFWYHLSSGLAREERSFVVEDNVNIDFSREKTSGYAPVYQHYSSMTIGNNVKWNQKNYQHFISNQDNESTNKKIKFGDRNLIRAEESSEQSIFFKGTGKNDVEFGPGSKLLIEGKGNTIDINENTSVRFRNPVGLDLESREGNIFSIKHGGSVDFEYVTMNVWKDLNMDNPDASFRKVKKSEMTYAITGTTNYVTVDSENKELVDWFKKTNPKKITTEMVPVGKIRVNYINHKTGEEVGEYDISDLHTEFDKTKDYEFLVDEELPLTKNIKEDKLPKNYRFASEEDLKETNKRQAKFVKTGMKKESEEENIEDPRVTDVYVHPEDIKFKVDYIYVDDNRTVRTVEFEEEMGKKIDLSKSPYVDKIYKGFRYAEDNELKEGQTQDGTVNVEVDKTYKIYIVSETEKGGIWGRVFDSEDKQPIPNAVIELPGIKRTVKSDENGFYLLPNLDSNIYTSIVSHDKYNSGANSIDVKSSMVYKDFYLDKNAINGGRDDRYLIRGLVQTVDESKENPAEGASIKVEGYDDLDITVDSYGMYAISNMEGNKDYSIEASKEGYSSSRKPIKIINKDEKIDFKLISGYSIQIIGKSGDKELYQYSIQTSKTAGKFYIEAMNVNEYKLIGSEHGELIDNKVEIDPMTYDKDKPLIFEYKYNMVDVAVQAIYRDGSKEKIIGEFTTKGEIGEKYKWEETTHPMIDGYIYNGMGEAIVVKEKDNLFKLYYIKSSGNLKINAIEKLEDGTTKIIGSINDQIEKDTTYTVLETLAPKENDISDLSYYTLESGHYIGEPGMTSFTYDGTGRIPEVNYIYKRKTSTLRIEAYDIKDNKKLPLKIDSSTVKKGENIEVFAPELVDTIKDNYELIGDSKQIVFFRYDENEKTVKFYYKQREKEMIDVIVELVSVDNKPIFSYKVPGETDKELTVLAPSLEGWKISGQDTNKKTIIPKISEENKLQFKYEKDIYYIDLKLVTKSGEIEKDLIEFLPEGVKTRYEAIRGTNHTIFAPQIPGYSIVSVDETYKEIKDIQKNEVIKFIYKPISEIIDDFTVDIKVVGKDTQENILYEYSINRPINSGDYTVMAFNQYGYEVYKKEEKITVKDIPLTVEFKYQSLGQKVYIKAETEDGSEIPGYTREIIDATKGQPFSANAPYIKGWDLVGSSVQTIDSVGEGKDTIIFKYSQIEGNVTIILREEAREGEKEGRIIKRETDEITVGGNKIIKAPDLKDDYYELVGPDEIEIAYKENQTIEFTYKKQTRKVKIGLYNISDKENEELLYYIDSDELYRIGDVAKINAPIESGFRLIGDSIKLIIVEDRKVPDDKYDVRFDYKSLDEKPIIILAKEVNENDDVLGEIQRIILLAQDGMKVKVTAPKFETHILIDEEVVDRYVQAGETVVFKYRRDTAKVSIKAKDSKGNDIDIPVGTKIEFEAVKNKDYTVYAPHIAGYVIKDDGSSSIKYNKIDGDKEAIFIYKPISEIVDDYVRDINIKGLDENGDELYSYRVNRPINSGKYTVNAFNQPGYKLIGDVVKEIEVEDKDINVVFKYKSLEEVITIKAVDGSRNKIEDYTEIKVLGQSGSQFTYNAPYIKGWKLIGDSIQAIDNVSESQNELIFEYEKAEGNIVVIAKEENGRVIKTESISGKVGEDITVNAPDLKDEYYVLKSKTPVVVKYSDEKQEIVFEYSKSKGKISLELVDTTDGEVIELEELSGEYRLGEVVEVVAPSRENLYLIGDAKKLVLVNEANVKVRYEYKSTEKDQITIEAIDSETGSLLQSTYVSLDKGTSINVKAPSFDTHKLAEDELESKLVKSGETVSFKYDKDIAKISIKAKDSKGNDIDIPVGTKTEFEAVKDKDYTVYAPHIAGYVIKDDEKSSIKYKKIDGDKEAIFIYKPISEIVDDYTVDVNVKGIVRATVREEEKELYNYNVTKAKNSGKYIVDAFAQEGYVLAKGENGEDLSQRVLDIADEDIQVIFIYEVGKTNVTIKLINDETGEEIIEDINGSKLEPISLEATKGQALTYNAPYILGYNLIGSSTIGRIENVTDTDNIIEFRYKLAEGNILVLLREKSDVAEENGRIIKSSSIVGSEGESIKIKADDLSLDYYDSLGYGGNDDGTEDPINELGAKEIDVVYKDSQQVFVFDYEKRKTKIDLKYNDMYNGELLEIVDASDDSLYRIGEVYTFHAPERKNRKILVDDKKNIIIKEPENNKLQSVSFDYKVLDLSDLVVKYLDNSGNELDRIVIKNKKIGEVYTHIYPKSITDKNGNLLDIVKFESDKLKVSESIFDNIMIFIYSKEVKEGPKPTPSTPEAERPIIVLPAENIKYTVKHIYKDEKGKSIDIIKPITKSGKQGEKIKLVASKDIDSRKYKLISDSIVEIEVGKGSGLVIFEYKNVNINGKDGNSKLNKKDHFQYIEGYKDGTVRPNANITREEVASIVYRILDEEYRNTIKKDSHKFKDVSQTRWSRKYIGTLENGKIIEGYKNGTFRATANITRAEAVTMLSRLYSDSPTGTNTFKDSKGHWAEKAIGSAVDKGIVQGYENGSFRPDKKITRAEFVTMVNNLLDRKVKEENMLSGRKEFKDLKQGQWYYTDMQEAVNGHEYEMLENNIEKWTKLRTFDIDF